MKNIVEKFEIEQGRIYDKTWEEQREGRNSVIIL